MTSTKDNKIESVRSALGKGSDTAFDFHCDLCDRDNNHVKAIGYCADCEDYLCQECYNHHLKPKPMRHHVLLDQHKMPKETSSQRQSKDMCTEPCTTHKHEPLQYYCSDHDQFGCGVCITLCHRNCVGIDNIRDIAGDVLTSLEYKTLKMKVKELTKIAKEGFDSTHVKTKTTNQQHSIASLFFKQMREDVLAAVDRLETSCMKDTGKIRDENQIKIKSVEEQHNKLLKDITAMDSKFTSLEIKGDHCQIFFSMKRSQDEITALETSLLQLQDQSHITEYVLRISDGLRSLFQKPENMASLKILNNPSTSSLQAASTGLRKTKSHKKSKAVHIGDIGVRMSGERVRVPLITSSVVLPGDKLAIVDNYTVKLINLQSKEIVSHLMCDSRLWDIAAVNNTQVVVTCIDDYNILFINVTTTLTLDHAVKLRAKCRGVACISDNLVITYDYPVKVEIISKEGNLLQTVVTEDRGEQLFSSPMYVVLSPDQQNLYISDWERQTVTCLALSGQVKATYKDDEMKWPNGLTVDRDGVLYVCGEYSYNIHQLTPDLHKIQILLQEPDGIVCPKCVSYNGEQDKLFIGMFNSGFKVYHLQ